ncbi:MAG: hypothetical protein C4289_02155 [Chloroflexota bacterium]
MSRLTFFGTGATSQVSWAFWRSALIELDEVKTIARFCWHMDCFPGCRVVFQRHLQRGEHRVFYQHGDLPAHKLVACWHPGKIHITRGNAVHRTIV